MGRQKTTKQFIEEAKMLCKNEFLDFSKVEYKNTSTKVIIICHKKDIDGVEHGEFKIRPNDFLLGHYCPRCGREAQIRKRRADKNEFIEKCKTVHEEEIDYSKVEYINSRTKVCLICPEHGEFWVTPANYLRGSGCPKCRRLLANKKHNENAKDTFIKKAIIRHNGYYIYDETVYVNSRSLIDVICPKHGKFTIRANAHLNGNGCRLCGIEKNADRNRSTLFDFITKGDKIHNGKYDYSLSEYVNSYIPIKIICPIHGVFEQMPYKHLDGHGCPKCNQSHLETIIEKVLIDNNIKYQYQKKFSWLGLQSLDFYLTDYRIAIECQGRQHFESIIHFGGEKGFNNRIRLDKLKRELCIENGVELIYFTSLKDVDVEHYMGCGCYTNTNVLINAIKESKEGEKGNSHLI